MVIAFSPSPASPASYEVRVKIIYTSLCHNDLTFWRMKDPSACFPRIFGHEAYGVVESEGEKVEEFMEGDTVVPVFLAQCTECVDCVSTRSNMCSKFSLNLIPGMPRDGTTRFTSLWHREV